MTEPSFPPELLREIGDLRRRVYELERRRQPPTDVMRTALRLEDLSDVSIDQTTLTDENLVAWSDAFQVWRALPFPVIPASQNPALIPSVNFSATATASSSPIIPVWTSAANSTNSPDIGITAGELVMTGGPHLVAVSLKMDFSSAGTWTRTFFQSSDSVGTYRENGGGYFSGEPVIAGGASTSFAHGSWIGLYTTGDVIAATAQCAMAGGAGSATVNAHLYYTELL